MTLPKPVRERLGLTTGDRLDVAVEGKRIVRIPKTLHLSYVCWLLPYAGKPATLDDMEDAIAEGELHGDESDR